MNDMLMQAEDDNQGHFHRRTKDQEIASPTATTRDYFLEHQNHIDYHRYNNKNTSFSPLRLDTTMPSLSFSPPNTPRKLFEDDVFTSTIRATKENILNYFERPRQQESRVSSRESPDSNERWVKSPISMLASECQSPDSSERWLRSPISMLSNERWSLVSKNYQNQHHTSMKGQLYSVKQTYNHEKIPGSSRPTNVTSKRLEEYPFSIKRLLQTDDNAVKKVENYGKKLCQPFSTFSNYKVASSYQPVLSTYDRLITPFRPHYNPRSCIEEDGQHPCDECAKWSMGYLHIGDSRSLSPSLLTDARLYKTSKLVKEEEKEKNPTITTTTTTTTTTSEGQIERVDEKLSNRTRPSPHKHISSLSHRKRRRHRTAFTPTQLLGLENSFERGHYIVGDERRQLAAFLRLSETQIKVWFQNRRTKHKRQRNAIYDDTSFADSDELYEQEN